jgi:hypothetical protein
MTTGCEVGVYAWNGKTLLGSPLYENIGENDMLNMSVTLIKNNRVLFRRSALHWWLTGFRLGEFTNPEELVMEAGITLKTAAMRAAFVDALANLGYTDTDARVYGNTVTITFAAPKTRQPASRAGALVRLTQRKNMLLCREYRRLTRGCNGMYDVITTLRTRSPALYDAFFKMGRGRELYRDSDNSTAM